MGQFNQLITLLVITLSNILQTNKLLTVCPIFGHDIEPKFCFRDLFDERHGRLQSQNLFLRHDPLALVQQLLGELVVDSLRQVVDARVRAHLRENQLKFNTIETLICKNYSWNTSTFQFI
jgi:hypothetical protein